MLTSINLLVLEVGSLLDEQFSSSIGSSGLEISHLSRDPGTTSPNISPVVLSISYCLEAKSDRAELTYTCPLRRRPSPQPYP